MNSLGKYAKFVVALAGTATIALDTIAPHANWVPTVIGAITAVVTYLVPNSATTKAVSEAKPGGTQ